MAAAHLASLFLLSVLSPPNSLYTPIPYIVQATILSPCALRTPSSHHQLLTPQPHSQRLRHRRIRNLQIPRQHRDLRLRGLRRWRQPRDPSRGGRVDQQDRAVSTPSSSTTLPKTQKRGVREIDECIEKLIAGFE